MPRTPTASSPPTASVFFAYATKRQPSSWNRMRRLIRMAARRLPRSELHHFHARPIRIVRVQAVLPIAPDFRSVEFLQALLLQLSGRNASILHAQRKMILHAQFFVIGVRRN